MSSGKHHLTFTHVKISMQSNLQYLIQTGMVTRRQKLRIVFSFLEKVKKTSQGFHNECKISSNSVVYCERDSDGVKMLHTLIISMSSWELLTFGSHNNTSHNYKMSAN